MSIEKTINDLTAAISALVKATEENTAAAREMLAMRTVGTPTAKATPVTEVVEQVTPEADEAPAKKPAKKKPAKKKPEPEAGEAEAGEAEAGEAEAGEAETPSEADVKAAALRVRDEVGVDALAVAKKALNVKKISEIPEQNRALFIRKCTQLIDDAEV